MKNSHELHILVKNGIFFNKKLIEKPELTCRQHRKALNLHRIHSTTKFFHTKISLRRTADPQIAGEKDESFC